MYFFLIIMTQWVDYFWMNAVLQHHNFKQVLYSVMKNKSALEETQNKIKQLLNSASKKCLWKIHTSKNLILEKNKKINNKFHICAK